MPNERVDRSDGDTSHPRNDEQRRIAKNLGWNTECVWEWAQQLERELAESERTRAYFATELQDQIKLTKAAEAARPSLAAPSAEAVAFAKAVVRDPEFRADRERIINLAAELLRVSKAQPSPLAAPGHSLVGEKDTKLLLAHTPAKTMAPGYELEYFNLTMVRRKGDVVLTVRLPSEFSHYEQTDRGKMAAWHPGAVSCVRFGRELWRSFVEQIAAADKVFQACDSLDGEMGFDADDPATPALIAALFHTEPKEEK